MTIPVPDYLSPGSFGSLELRQGTNTEFIGQPIDYSSDKAAAIRCLTLDSLELARVDFIKIDVEGMELETIGGAAQSIARTHPILLVEAFKTDRAVLRARLEGFGYQLFDIGINLLAVHTSDKSLGHITPTTVS